MGDLAVHYSSENQDWCTPPLVLDSIREVGPIILDPCAARIGLVNAAVEWYGPPGSIDGLSRPWTGPDLKRGVVYMNPPYADVAAWVARASSEAWAGAEVVALIPARPDTKYWHNEIFKFANAICFWRGRITFVGAPHAAPFPSAVVYWGPNLRRFEAAMSSRGKVIRL